MPSDSEFKTLEMFLGMSQSQADGFNLRGTTEGGKLKSQGTTYWNSPNAGATNSSGLDIRANGQREGSNGSFNDLKIMASIWLSNEYFSFGMERQLTYSSSQINRAATNRKSGQQLRLIIDAPTNINGSNANYVGNDGRVYACVLVGNQWWLSEELKETQYRDHSPIPLLRDSTAWMNDTTGARCYYVI